MKKITIILIVLIAFTSCSTLKFQHEKTLHLVGKISNKEIVDIDFYTYSCGIWICKDYKMDASKYEYHFNIEKDYKVIFTNKLGHEKILYVKHGDIDGWDGRLKITFEAQNKYAYLYQKNDYDYGIRFSNSDDYMQYFGIKNK